MSAPAAAAIGAARISGPDWTRCSIPPPIGTPPVRAQTTGSRPAAGRQPPGPRHCLAAPPIYCSGGQAVGLRRSVCDRVRSCASRRRRPADSSQAGRARPATLRRTEIIMDDVSRRAVSRLASRLRSRLRRRAALTAAPALLVLPLLAGVSGSAVPPQAAAAGPQDVPAVNWALSGQASATSTESGDPASSAIDGDAGTDWCTGSWTGSLVIDLGQVRALSDLGITLDATSPSASATIKVAAQAGNWQAVRPHVMSRWTQATRCTFRFPGVLRPGTPSSPCSAGPARTSAWGSSGPTGRTRGRGHVPRRRPVLHPPGTRRRGAVHRPRAPQSPVTICARTAPATSGCGSGSTHLRI